MVLADNVHQQLEQFQPVMAPSPLTQLLASCMQVQAGSIVVDAGCGSGVLSLTAVEHGARFVYAIDTNPRALAETAALAKRAGCPRRVLPILADLGYLSDILPGRIDTILCNPPQLPSRGTENRDSGRSAYDAGSDGRRYIRVLISEVRNVFARRLSRMPSLQLVTTSVADPDSTTQELREAGFDVSVIAEAAAAFRPAYHDVLNLLAPGSYFSRNGEFYERLSVIRAVPRRMS